MRAAFLDKIFAARRSGGEQSPGVERSRRSFLHRWMLTTAAVVPGAWLSARTARAGGGGDGDGDADDLPELYPHENRRAFYAIRRHENAHVAFLLSALGSAARPRPTFMNLLQPNIYRFVAVSRALENTGVGAYLGAAPYILNPDYLAAAGSIMDIEGRHAGYLDILLNKTMTVNVFDEEQSFETPLSPNQVDELVAPFVESLNGGPPVTFAMKRSPRNDIMILNYALALEFLEQEFYNLNVPIYFGAEE
jgi:hypothetical protein